MKKIKFRAWDRDTKNMIGWDTIVAHWNFLAFEQPYHVFMQYTGLKDKNGKEIYEGDIVRPTWNTKLQLSFVLYQPPEFIMKVKKTDRRWHTFDEAGEIQSLYVVIGNIYENLELLKL